MRALAPIQFKVTMLLVASLVLTAFISTLVVVFLMKNDATGRLEGIRAVMTREKVEALSDKVKIAYHVVNASWHDDCKMIRKRVIQRSLRRIKNRQKVR